MSLLKRTAFWFSLLSLILVLSCFENEKPKHFKQQDENLGYQTNPGFEPDSQTEFNKKPNIEPSKNTFTSPKKRSGFESNDQ